jgi:hypothetical protein
MPINIRDGGGSSSPTTTRGDLIYRGANADERLAKGSAGQMLRMDFAGTDPTWADRFSPSRESIIFEDWRGGTAFGTNVGIYTWSNTSGSSGAAAMNLTTLNNAKRPGILRQRVATNGAYIINSMWTDKLFGGGTCFFETAVYFAQLNNGTDDVLWSAGFHSATNASEAQHGVYFLYDNSNAKIQLVTATSGTRTKTAVGSDLAATTWYRFGYLVNAAGTSVQAYINGVAVGAPNTTNFPLSSTGLSIQTAKAAGNGTCDVWNDYIYVHEIFSAAREA